MSFARRMTSFSSVKVWMTLCMYECQLLVPKTEQRALGSHNGPKHLHFVDLRVLGDAREDGRVDEVALVSDTVAAKLELYKPMR